MLVGAGLICEVLGKIVGVKVVDVRDGSCDITSGNAIGDSLDDVGLVVNGNIVGL